MRTLIKELRDQLERDLHAVNPDQPQKAHDKKWRLAQGAIWTLHSLADRYPFESKADEIEYFKHEAPFFYMTGMFHSSLSKLELNRIILDQEGFAEYVDHAYAVTAGFLRKFRFLHGYYHSGRTDKDYRFTASEGSIQKLDCRASITLGKILAYERVRPILQSERDRLQGSNRGGIELVLDKNETTELIIAFYEAGSIWINGKAATINQLAEIAGPFLRYGLTDILSVDNRNRMRKKDPTPLMHKLIKALKDRAERLL